MYDIVLLIVLVGLILFLNEEGESSQGGDT